MPKRPKQHQLEDISRNEFSRILPREWVFRDKDKDYGIDAEVEIFDADGNATGLVFWVQLKATEEKNIDKAKKISLSLDSLSYFKSLELPVMVVRYVSKTNSLYYRWSHEIDPYPIKHNQQSKVIVFDEKLTCGNTHQITSYIKKINKIKKRNFYLPIKASIETKSQLVTGLEKWLFESNLRTELNKFKDIVCVDKNENDSLVQLIISGNELKVSMSGLAGCVIHNIDKVTCNIEKELAKSSMIGISLALAKLGSPELAAKIILKPEVANFLYSNEKFAVHLLPSILKTTYFEAIVEQLIDNLDDQKSNIIETIALSSSIGLRTESSNEKIIEKLLVKSLEKYKNNGWEGLYGSAHYNLANFYRSVSQFKNSLKHYFLAQRYEPNYLGRDYFHRELAGVLFELRRYKLSANSYKKALEIGDEIFDKALCADALMYSGQYREALELLTDYTEHSCEVSPTWHLKLTFLDSLIENTGIEKQIRKSKKAARHIGVDKSGEVSLKNLEETLELDYLYGLAWYNLGGYFFQSQEIVSAQLCYMSCAVLQPWDIEAWVNAIKLGFSNETPIGLLPLMIAVGYRHGGEKFLQQIYRLVEGAPPEYRDAFLQMISDHLLELENLQDAKELRIIGADKSVVKVLAFE
jgi:tetratricopeptide (TPR) repeat protein